MRADECLDGGEEAMAVIPVQAPARLRRQSCRASHDLGKQGAQAWKLGRLAL